MFNRSRLKTLPLMILDSCYTQNVSPQSLNNFTGNDFGLCDYTRKFYPQWVHNFTRNDFG